MTLIGNVKIPLKYSIIYLHLLEIVIGLDTHKR